MTSEKDFWPKPYTEEVTSGFSEWCAPSNIALVKYWGKKPHQLPANPSISFTLSNCRTVTKLSYEKLDKPVSEFSFDLLFEGQPKEDFKPKVNKLFERVIDYLPFLKDYHFTIDTQNTFPHSSGIASSASSMAALAMNLMDLERRLNPQMTDDYFYEKASFLSRLGSGSACRSVRGSIVVWGHHPDIAGSSDLYGVAYPSELHPIFMNVEDTILLVDRGQKQVSSTIGHELMHNHPFATARFAQANANMSRMNEILQSGDLDGFISVVEGEALTLHAMMMTSQPYFMLMKPQTLEIINRIWNYRKTTNIPVCFTLDAGANVHVLFPQHVKTQVSEFIQHELVPLCENRQFIVDQVGNGVEKLM